MPVPLAREVLNEKLLPGRTARSGDYAYAHPERRASGGARTVALAIVRTLSSRNFAAVSPAGAVFERTETELEAQVDGGGTRTGRRSHRSFGSSLIKRFTFAAANDGALTGIDAG